MEDNNGNIPYSIFDFLLFKPMSDDLLKKLLSMPPPSPPSTPLIFKKSLLIRSISSDPFSENTLSCIETILQQNRYAYTPSKLAVVQNAYFHAAVGSTLNELKKGDYSRYLSAVNRFWTTRVDDLDVDLVSGKLLKWKEFMICGVEDYIMRETMLIKWNEKEGRDAILVFKLAEIDGMEPISLKLTVLKMMDITENNVDVMEGADDLNLNSVNENNGFNCTVDKSDALGRDNIELGGNDSGVMPRNSISTAEVKKVTGDLKKSCEDLKKVVHDPLPVIMSASPSTPIGVHDDNSPVADRDQYEAHVESEVDSDDSSYHASKKIRLSLPRGLKVSPLEPIESPKLPRKGRRWTDVEVKTLREGVVKYGKGNWRTIKINYPSIFQDKTVKALKLKWRNLSNGRT